MSATEEIRNGLYFFQLASTDPFQLTKKYAADDGLDKQILLKPGPDFRSEAWRISPVETEANTYLITKLGSSDGFMLDTQSDQVILGNVPAKWFFYRVEEPTVPPNVYFIRPVDHPDGVGVGFYLGPNATKDAVIIDTVPVIPNMHPPAWQVLPLPVDAQ